MSWPKPCWSSIYEFFFFRFFVHSFPPNNAKFCIWKYCCRSVMELNKGTGNQPVTSCCSNFIFLVLWMWDWCYISFMCPLDPLKYWKYGGHLIFLWVVGGRLILHKHYVSISRRLASWLRYTYLKSEIADGVIPPSRVQYGLGPI